MYHFIVNPASSSGRGAVLWKEIEKKLMADQIPYVLHMTAGDGDARRFAADITKTEDEVTIVVCGGDGTMNEVVNGIRDFGLVTLGCIPIGSSNDLTRDLGQPKDAAKMLQVILHPNKIVPMDIGKLRFDGGEKNFAVSMGIGFDAAICHEALHSKIKDVLNKLKIGKLTYLGIALKQLASAKKNAAVVILDDEQEIHVDRLLFVTAMVHRYEGGVFKFCPDADYADGYLDVLVVGNLSKAKVLRVLPTALKGEHTRFDGLKVYRAKKVVVKTHDPMPVHVDGESAGIRSAVTVTQEDKQVRMII